MPRSARPLLAGLALIICSAGSLTLGSRSAAAAPLPRSCQSELRRCELNVTVAFGWCTHLPLNLSCSRQFKSAMAQCRRTQAICSLSESRSIGF